MELQLKNIGMIKEANVKIDGLTVIAGENDTGKSTVGKALYVVMNTLEVENITSKLPFDSEIELHKKFLMEKIFKQNDLFDDSAICLFQNNGEICLKKDIVHIDNNNIQLVNFIFIETPLVWNFKKLFGEILHVESKMKIELDYPHLMKDLNFKLSIKSQDNGIDIKDEIIFLINGKFDRDEKAEFFFNKNGKRIELVNTATGIKYFGIFQVLSQNNYLNSNTVLVLDEPEVHLHPKWQLEMAKIIVELVKNGIKILVNSHSPYMLEALQRYSEVEKIEDRTNFYLAEDGIIDKVEESNALTLEKIFGKLSEPFDVFDEMDARILRGE